MRRSIQRSGLAIFYLLAGVAAVSAAPAVATTDLNVRAGQSTQYPVVGVLPQGAMVDVTGCADGWCFVHDYGAYASARYLDRRPTAYAPQAYYRPPGLSFGMHFGSPRYRYW